MKNLVGACLFAQSGGPTSVINASAAGVFLEALKQDSITAVYGAAHGIKGVINGDLYDIGKEDIEELELLKHTPSSAMGSVRYKLKDAQSNPEDYQKILEVFKKYNIRFFFYNGGNDSMDTGNKISKFMEQSGWDCNVIGVPKTIDNDLAGTDHCPGFGSAAKYIATTCAEIVLDARVYDTGLVCILEVMGRNAGWLTGAAALSGLVSEGVDLIYMPERPFDLEKFVSQVKEVCDKNNNHCIVVVSEGIRYAGGSYVGLHTNVVDHFGHAQLGGVGTFLASVVRDRLGVKTREIEFSLMQRCAAHVASGTDIEEAFNAGREAVKAAVSGETDKMVAFVRKPGDKYEIEYKLVPLEIAANTEKKIPESWIADNGAGVTQEFIDYALPLVNGASDYVTEKGLPRFARLKKIKVAK